MADILSGINIKKTKMLVKLREEKGPIDPLILTIFLGKTPNENLRNAIDFRCRSDSNDGKSVTF